MSALTTFLREHYTTKPASAAALAAYLLTPGIAKLTPQAPTTGPKPAEEKPAAKPRTAATATAAEPDKQPEAETAAPAAPAAPREATKPPVDPVVAKLNSYAAARGEPKDTARLATPANSGAEGGTPSDDPNAKRKPGDKKKKDTNATGDTAAPHPPRPRRAQAPVIQPPPGNN